MSKTSNRYLGLDLSLEAPGLAVVEVRRGKPHILFLDSVKTKAEWGEGRRLEYIAAWMTLRRYEWGPFAAIIREQAPNGRNAFVNRALFGVRAISELCFRDIDTPFEEYAPNTIKKAIGGHGHAKKDAVERGVLTYFPDAKPRNDNESDALAVALTYLIDKNIVEPARK